MTSRHAQRRPRMYLLVAIALAAALAFIYSPGLHGPFVLDDTENITLNPGVALKDFDTTGLRQALVSNDSGPFKRPLASLSFALNHYLAGGFDNTFPFKLSNLVIHGINSLLVFLLVLRLARLSSPRGSRHEARAFRIAALTAGLWALHPIQLTNVLYVVQRMNSLSALFVFLGMLVFLHGRARLKSQPRQGLWLMTLGVLGGSALGSLAKENALLLPLLALVLEYTLLKGFARASPLRRTLSTFYVLTALLPFCAGLLLLLLQPDQLLAGYVARPFTPFERVLTEARVLWIYLGLLLLPVSSNLGLFHDGIAVSTGLFTPLSTFPAVAGLCAVLAAAVLTARRYPVAALGVLWYLAAHSLESGLLGLEIAFEHRNYVPGLGVFLSLSWGAVRLAGRLDTRRKKLSLAVAGMVLISLGAVTWVRANTWSDIRVLAFTEARHHPDSPRANDLAARISLEGDDVPGAVRYTVRGMQAAPREAGFHIELRILLAQLSLGISELGQTPSSPGLRAGTLVSIEGLPGEFVTTTRADRLWLEHPGSADADIDRLLRSQPITTHGVIALENLTHCLISGQPACRSLHAPAMAWLGIALENPRTGKIYRASLAANAARLHARRNDWRRALELMNRAAELAPRHMPYRLDQIDYLLSLGQADKAGEIMSRMSQAWPQNDIQWTVNRTLIDGIIARMNARDG